MANFNPNHARSQRTRWVATACLLALLAAAWLLTPARYVATPRVVETSHPSPAPAATQDAVAVAFPAAREVAVLEELSNPAVVSVVEGADAEPSDSAWRVRDAGPVPTADFEAPFVPLASEAGLAVRTIADDAWRVGLYTANGGTRPVLLEPGSGATPTVNLLDVLHGGTWSLALSVNGGGQAAGSVGLTEGAERPVRWLENGEAVEMDTLPGGRGRVNGINGEGRMVGWSLDIDGRVHATMWAEDGIPVDLNTSLPEGSTWELEQALAVSDSGNIYGVGRLDGHPRLFTLSPASAVAATP